MWLKNKKTSWKMKGVQWAGVPATAPVFTRSLSLDHSLLCHHDIIVFFWNTSVNWYLLWHSILLPLVPSYYSSLLRTGLSPAIADKPAERAALHFGLKCCCEVISCSLAERGNTEVLLLFGGPAVIKFGLISNTFHFGFLLLFSPRHQIDSWERFVCMCMGIY